MKANKLSHLLKMTALSGVCCLLQAPALAAEEVNKVSYCSANGGGDYEWINGVTIDGTTNTSGGLGRDNGLEGYSDFTAQTLNLSNGNLTLTPGFSGNKYTQYWSIWIDSNQDGSFDASEQVLNGLAGDAAVQGRLTVPDVGGALTTRMRIVMRYGGAASSACGDIGSGEVEDYSVFIDKTTQPPVGELPNVCAGQDPFTGRNLVSGEAVCLPSGQKVSLSIANSDDYASIAISTSHGIGNLSLFAKNGSGFPRTDGSDPSSKHVGNTECLVLSNPSDYWTNIVINGLHSGASIVADLGATECRVTPGDEDGGNTGYKYDHVNIQVFRFNFTDSRLDWSQEQMLQDLEAVKTYYAEQSYGRFDVSWQVNPAIEINEPKSKYDGDTHGWRALFREKIQASGVNPDFPGEATIILVAAPQVGNLNSQAGPPLMEIYHHQPGTIAHEVGHALGLRHAKALEAGNSIIGSSNDSITNYGNVYSMMGMGAHTLEEYNLTYKSYFGWLNDNEVPLVTASGTYRIYAFDHGTAAGTNAPGNIGLRLKSGDGDKTYWLEYRTTHQRYTNSKNGVLVNLQGYLENEPDPSFWNHTSALLDMTPNSQSTVNWDLEDQTDSELVIGASFTDHWNGFRITPVAKGGTEDTANAWIEVEVELLN